MPRSNSHRAIDARGSTAIGPRRVTLVVPGSIQTHSGGYEYDRRIVAALRERGWTVDVREIDGSFPNPTRAALDAAAHVLAGIASGGVVLIDGLAGGAMPDELERESRRLRIVPIVHMALASDAGIDAATAAQFEARERRSLQCAARAVVTGASTGALLESYGVSADRIARVEPGTDRGPIASGSRSSDCIHLVCVATVSRGKGQEILITALASIPDRNWRLTCAGSLSRDPETVARLRRLLTESHLDDCVTLAGDLDKAALSACYDSADVFVLATLRETYGMAVAEAIARGLPVVSTATGEIPKITGGGGVIVPPGDVDAFAAALSSVLRDAHLRDRLRAQAARARERLRTWDQAGDEMAALLAGVATNG